MALRRFTTAVDGTIPIPALLYSDEDLLTSQDGVGIYDGCVPFLPISATGFYCHMQLIVRFIIPSINTKFTVFRKLPTISLEPCMFPRIASSS